MHAGLFSLGSPNYWALGPAFGPNFHLLICTDFFENVCIISNYRCNTKQLSNIQSCLCLEESMWWKKLIFSQSNSQHYNAECSWQCWRFRFWPVIRVLLISFYTQYAAYLQQPGSVSRHNILVLSAINCWSMRHVHEGIGGNEKGMYVAKSVLPVCYRRSPDFWRRYVVNFKLTLDLCIDCDPLWVESPRAFTLTFIQPACPASHWFAALPSHYALLLGWMAILALDIVLAPVSRYVSCVCIT